MRTVLFLLTAAFLVITGCKTKEESNPIEGAWNLFYVKNVVNDKVVSEFPITYQGSDIKIWTKEHWCFVGRYVQDTVHSDNYGGGTYTISGNVYVENIEYHAHKSYVGQKIKMLMTVKSDTLIQIWPMDDKGDIDKSNCHVERYIRLK